MAFLTSSKLSYSTWNKIARHKSQDYFLQKWTGEIHCWHDTTIHTIGQHHETVNLHPKGGAGAEDSDIARMLWWNVCRASYRHLYPLAHYTRKPSQNLSTQTISSDTLSRNSATVRHKQLLMCCSLLWQTCMNMASQAPLETLHPPPIPPSPNSHRRRNSIWTCEKLPHLRQRHTY